MIVLALILAANTSGHQVESPFAYARCVTVFDVLQNGSTTNICSACDVKQREPRGVPRRNADAIEVDTERALRELEINVTNTVADWVYEPDVTVRTSVVSQFDFTPEGVDPADVQNELPRMAQPTRNSCSGYSRPHQH